MIFITIVNITLMSVFTYWNRH